MQAKKPFSESMADCLRSILSCCDSADETEEERPALQISGPTNFRREDITLPGLTPEQQQFIRQKAVSDAQKMWAHLQPLRSSPSGHFASPNSPTTIIPTYEEFTTPRSASITTPPNTANTAPSPTSHRGSASWSDRVKRHSRKISNSLTKPLGYHAVSDEGEVDLTERRAEESKYEMRALMESTRSRPVSAGKMSSESYENSGSEFGERDGAKRFGSV